MNATSRCGTALAFHDTTFDALDRDGQVWLRAQQIGQALGYADEKSINRIYSRNASEFTDSMTEVIRATTSGNLITEIRIFSLRGAHLLGMFARTARAAEFRRWVLDVLDQQVKQPAPSAAPGAPFVPGNHVIEARRKFSKLAEQLPEAQYQELMGDADMQQLADGYLAHALAGRRWLVSFDCFGRQNIAPVPDEASVLTYADVAQRLGDPGVPLRDVATIAEAAVKRLQGAVARALPSSQTRAA